MGCAAAVTPPTHPPYAGDDVDYSAWGFTEEDVEAEEKMGGGSMHFLH
jgi:hypothetical protein